MSIELTPEEQAMLREFEHELMTDLAFVMNAVRYGALCRIVRQLQRLATNKAEEEK